MNERRGTRTGVRRDEREEETVVMMEKEDIPAGDAPLSLDAIVEAKVEERTRHLERKIEERLGQLEQRVLDALIKLQDLKMATSSGESAGYRGAATRSFIRAIEHPSSPTSSPATSSTPFSFPDRSSYEKDGRESESDNGVIGVNVGGKVFYTLRSTLCKYPDSFLGAMFGGLHFNTKDKEGNYFIDRNPKYFKHILNFLRQGTVPRTNLMDEEKRQDFMDEAEYYGLTEYLFPDEAARQFCEQGYAFAKGEGVPKDMQKAIWLLEKAAQLGNPKALNRLAMCYYSGEGVPQNYETAVSLYEKAASKGLAWAQYNLGLCYRHGYGVQAAEDTARYWFLKAAEQGHVKARQKLSQD